jgi:hypothetical protein
MLRASSYHAVVVGGGQNGLVCAAYLARVGLTSHSPWPVPGCGRRSWAARLQKSANLRSDQCTTVGRSCQTSLQPNRCSTTDGQRAAIVPNPLPTLTGR